MDTRLLLYQTSMILFWWLLATKLFPWQHLASMRIASMSLTCNQHCTSCSCSSDLWDREAVCSGALEALPCRLHIASHSRTQTRPHWRPARLRPCTEDSRGILNTSWLSSSCVCAWRTPPALVLSGTGATEQCPDATCRDRPQATVTFVDAAGCDSRTCFRCRWLHGKVVQAPTVWHQVFWVLNSRAVEGTPPAQESKRGPNKMEQTSGCCAHYRGPKHGLCYFFSCSGKMELILSAGTSRVGDPVLDSLMHALMCDLRHAPTSERCALSTCVGDSASPTCPRDRCSSNHRSVFLRLGCTDPMLQHVSHAPGPSHKILSQNSCWELGAPTRVYLRTPQGISMHAAESSAARCRRWVAVIKSLLHYFVPAQDVLAMLCVDLGAAPSVGAMFPARGLQVPWKHAQVVTPSVCCTCSSCRTVRGSLTLPTTGVHGCATSCGHRGGVDLGVLELHLALASYRDEPLHYPRGACFGCAGHTRRCLGPAKMLAWYALDFFCTLGFPVWWSLSFSFAKMAPWWDDRHSWSHEHTGWNWSWHGWQAEHEAVGGWNWHAVESERASSDRTRTAGHTRQWQDDAQEVQRSIPERTQSSTTRQSRRPPSRFRTGQVSAELWRPDNPSLGRRLEASLATSSALPSLPLTEMGGSPHLPSLDEDEEDLNNVAMDNGPGPWARGFLVGGRWRQYQSDGPFACTPAHAAALKATAKCCGQHLCDHTGTYYTADCPAG